jgi:hypothetical protein
MPTLNPFVLIAGQAADDLLHFQEQQILANLGDRGLKLLHQRIDMLGLAA